VRSKSSKPKREIIWNGPVVKTLEKVYGRVSPVSLFIERAREICGRLRIPGPPFSPFEYAKGLGIEVQFSKGLGIDGMLSRRKGGTFVATLKDTSSCARMNFTLAHEIAHTFFYSDLEEFGEKFRNNVVFDPEEERLCDLAAAELLMPFSSFSEELERRTDQRGIIASTVIVDLARLYRVSIVAAAIRVAWVSEDVTCAIWKQGQGIENDWITPIGMRRLSLCQTGATSVEQAFQSCGDVVTGVDTFYRRGRKLVRTASSHQFLSGKVFSVLQPAGRLRERRDPPSKGTGERADSTLPNHLDLSGVPMQLELF
jgi:hypothetical protein